MPDKDVIKENYVRKQHGYRINVERSTSTEMDIWKG